jgi:ABC-type polysaccharide/polyol phosphate transport system ATPase subunit
MSSEYAIKVEGLGKCYQIYSHPRDRLKQFFLPKLQHIIKKNSNRYYKEFWALEDISFEVARGTSLGILGLNGAGKSTLLQIICKTLNPTSGSVSVNGRVAALLELGAGFNPEFTGLENIYLNGSIIGISRIDIENKIDQILEFADIGEFINQPVKTYSSGMYVRLAFAIAIHSDPEILIIDEALAVGDFIFQQKCNLFIKEKLAGVTKIFVSHDIGAVANMTEKAIVLRQGKLIFYGDSQSAIQAYQISSRATQIGQPLLDSDGECENDFKALNIFDLRQQEGSQKWMDVDPASLSGSMESKIVKYTWHINNKKHFNLVRAEDKIDINFEIICDGRIENPIFGYQVQDRFGVVVFGQNTIDSNISVSQINAGRAIVSMQMKWPEISNGKYSITIGVGDGAHGEAHHIVCWAHNIVTFDFVSDIPIHGIFNNRITELRVN